MLVNWALPFKVGDVIKVWTPRFGGVWHFGIVSNITGSPFGLTSVTVIDNCKSRGCVGFTTLDEFAQGNQVCVHRSANPSEVNLILQRAVARLNHRYHATQFNCEDFVSWVIEGVARSEQVNVRLLLAGIACVVGLVWVSNRAQ
jgi:hypothetical protein